jgi:hypothetical protein
VTRGKVRTIDPSLNLGLHELANSRKGRVPFRFQLEFAKQQTENILKNLDNLVIKTIEKAPKREGNFCLGRVTDPKLKHEEDKWERAMFKEWGPKGSGEFVSMCKRIQAYQYPLQHSHKDKYWGEIDLLGIATDFLPVPIELKTNARESPLRMLVEVAAYGIAIRAVWRNLREHWVEALSWLDGSPSQFPPTLDKVTLVGAAPDEYWCRCLGQPETDPGAFPSEAWPPFSDLVDALGEKGFDIQFVAVTGKPNGTAGLPTITGARVIELRSLSGRQRALVEACQGTVHHSPSFRS